MREHLSWRDSALDRSSLGWNSPPPKKVNQSAQDHQESKDGNADTYLDGQRVKTDPNLVTAGRERYDSEQVVPSQYLCGPAVYIRFPSGVEDFAQEKVSR